MATTTNLMSLYTQSIKPVSASTRTTMSTSQKQSSNLYKNNAQSNRNFDKIFDKFNEATSSMSEDMQKIASDVAQEAQDPISAVTTTSAQGKSNETQDAPQKLEESQPAEEVTEIEEPEEPAKTGRVTTMSLFSFVSVTVEEQNIGPEDVNVEAEDKNNLMSIMPQSQDDDNKGQDMLNLLSGRTWKIHKQHQPGPQMPMQEQLAQSPGPQSLNKNFAGPQLPHQFRELPQQQGQPIMEGMPQSPQGLPMQNHFMLPNQPLQNRAPEMMLNNADMPAPINLGRPGEMPNFMPNKFNGPQLGNFIPTSTENMGQIQVPQQQQATTIIPTTNIQNTESNEATDPTAIINTNESDNAINLINSQGNDNSQQSQQQSQARQQEQPLISTLAQENNESQFEPTVQNLSNTQNTNQNQANNAQINQNQPAQQIQSSIPVEQNQQQPQQVDVQPTLPNNNVSQPQIPIQNPIENQPAAEQNLIPKENLQNQPAQQSQIDEEQPQFVQNDDEVAKVPSQNTNQSQTNTKPVSNGTEQIIPQGQPQQVTYQPQNNIQQPQFQQQQVQNPQQPQQVQQNQSQPAIQLETVEIPQVQAAVSENQPEVMNRQQPNQLNNVNQPATELEVDNSQPINPPQQATQQQSQNQQQQQNLQSQAQQSSIPEFESNNSSEAQQAPVESFAAHLGATVNNTNHQPLNNSTESVEQAPQSMPTEEEFTNQIVEHARLIRNAQNTEMVIQLKPEHLGELTLRVSAAANGSVNVSFQSDNVQVRAMLENTLAQLKNELSNQGIKVENVQVSAHLSDSGMMNDRGQQAWEQNQRGNNNSRIGRLGRVDGNSLTAAEESEMVSASVVNNVMSADSVDYRV